MLHGISTVSPPKQCSTESFLPSLASAACGALFRVSNGFIEDTQDPALTNDLEVTGHSSAAGMSAQRPSVKEETDGLDIHCFRRFLILNLQLGRSEAPQTEATIPPVRITPTPQQQQQDIHAQILYAQQLQQVHQQLQQRMVALAQQMSGVMGGGMGEGVQAVTPQVEVRGSAIAASASNKNVGTGEAPFATQVTVQQQGATSQQQHSSSPPPVQGHPPLQQGSSSYPLHPHTIRPIPQHPPPPSLQQHPSLYHHHSQYSHLPNLFHPRTNTIRRRIHSHPWHPFRRLPRSKGSSRASFTRSLYLGLAASLDKAEMRRGRGLVLGSGLGRGRLSGEGREIEERGMRNGNGMSLENVRGTGSHLRHTSKTVLVLLPPGAASAE